MLVVAPAVAQSDRFAPIVLQLPASAHAAALGDAFLTAREPDVLFYDPAQLSLARGMSVGAGRYGAPGIRGSLAAATTFADSGGVGIGAQFLSYAGPVERVPVSVRALGEQGPLAASSVALTLGGASVWRGTRFGASLQYAGDMLGSSRAGTVGATLAVARDVGEQRNVTVALVASELGPGLLVDDVRMPMPSRLSLGVGRGDIEVGPVDLALTGAVSLLRDGSLGAAGGGEVEYEWLDGYAITARVGVRQADRVGGERMHANGTIGFGLGADRLSLDYAFERVAGVSVHQIGLRLR